MKEETIYVADNGKVFSDKYECMSYELASKGGTHIHYCDTNGSKFVAKCSDLVSIRKAIANYLEMLLSDTDEDTACDIYHNSYFMLDEMDKTITVSSITNLAVVIDYQLIAKMF